MFYCLFKNKKKKVFDKYTPNAPNTFLPLRPHFCIYFKSRYARDVTAVPKSQTLFFFFRFCLLLHLDELFTMNTYLCRGHTRTHTHTHTSTF